MSNEQERTRPPRMGPGGRRGTPGEKPKNFKKAVLRLFKELNKYKILIFIAIILAVVGAVLSIKAPNKISDLTNKISAGLMGNMDFDGIKHIAIILAIMYIMSALSTFMQSIIMTNVSNWFAKSLRTRISEKFNS